MKSTLVTTLMFGLFACSSNNGINGGDGGNPDGGPGPVSGVYTLDSSPMDPTYISMAIGPNDRVGVAYFKNLSGTDYQIRYVEWQNGVIGRSEVVTQNVQSVYGVSVAFQGNGQPAIAYLGGDTNGYMSPFWFQSDVALRYRQGTDSWSQEQIAVRMSWEAPCGNPISDMQDGFVVGLFPALAFVGNTAYVAYRDVHQGQFPTQDWEGSDLELVSGTPGNWSHEPIVCGGNDKKAYGGYSQMVIGPGNQPAIVSTEIFNSADGSGINVLFHRRNATGGWTGTPWSSPAVPILNTQKGGGPSLAYDATLGYAIAVVERSDNTLYFSRSVNGAQWTSPDPVFQSGTGGWYPSIAIDPSTHEPVIAYYVCSTRAGIPEPQCPANERQLRLATRVLGSTWRHSTIDPRGGILPKLGFLSSGKRVIAYRDATNGALKLYADP